MGRSPPEHKIALHTNGCLVKRNSLELNNIQEPQKNRATHKNPRQDEFIKKETSSSRILKKRSYKECFVSPSGKFFAWMKRSSDKVMKNFCSDWPQTKVLKRVHPKQISRTTSTVSIMSLVRDSPPRGLRCSVKSEISLSGNLQDIVRVICKSEKTARNESMRCLGKKGRRSISRDKLQKEDKNEAVRRREPRRIRPKKDSDTSLSSSFSEIMETMDFDMTSNSNVEGARWQRSNEFHAQVFSCFGKPDYLLDASKHRRAECFRETDRQRRRREKRERKEVKRLEKKTAKTQKTCEKRRRQLAKREEKYASRCIIEGCDFGKDYRRKHPPIKLQQTTDEDSKEISGEPYQPKVFKKEEHPLIKQSYESGHHRGEDCREDKKLKKEEEVTEDCTCSESSEVSSRNAEKCLPELKKSVLSAERPSFERNTLKDFFKSFAWMYPKLEELCKEYPEKKRVGLGEATEIKEPRETKETKDVRRREKTELPTEEEHERFSKSSASDSELLHQNQLHRHDRDHVENCDCVRLYLESQVEKKLAALRNAQLSSKESLSSVSSKSSKKGEPKPESGKRKKKVRPKNKAHGPKVEYQKKKDFEEPKCEETVPKPECHDASRRQQPQPVPEHHKKPQPAIKKEKVNGHPNKNKKAQQAIKKETVNGHPNKNKRVRHRNERYCQYCGRAPCLIKGKRDIVNTKESSASSQAEELTCPPEGTSRPKKDQRKPHFSEPKDSALLSYLCRWWKNKNQEGPQPQQQRRRVRRLCRKCRKRQRNINNSIWRLEARRFPPEICIFRDDSLQANRTGAMPRGRTSDHPPTHSHCFLINNYRDDCCTRADMVCFPEDRHLERRCRPPAGGSCHRDQAIDCHFARDTGEWTDKTTETEEMRSDSCDRINRKNLKSRLASLHCLWKNLRRCTRQKAMLGRQVGRCIKRSLSGLDSYDCWWSDTWPKPRRQRHHHGGFREC